VAHSIIDGAVVAGELSNASEWLAKALGGWCRRVVSLVRLGVSVPPIFQSNPAEWDYQRGLEKDFANSDCLKYVNSDFASLKEPPFGEGGTCWHLYTSRFKEVRGSSSLYIGHLSPEQIG
jgi:hypothetical protein